MLWPPESSPLLSRTLEFDTLTSVVVPTSSQIEDLLVAGYTEAEVSVLPAQPATAPAIVAMTATSPADPSEDASTDHRNLHLSSDSDDGVSTSQFSVQARDAAAPSEPPAE